MTIISEKNGTKVLARKDNNGTWRSTESSGGKMTSDELRAIVDAAATEMLASLSIALDIPVGPRIKVAGDELILEASDQESPSADRMMEDPVDGGGGGAFYTVYFGWCTNGWTGPDRMSREDARRDADGYKSKHGDAGTCSTGSEQRKRK